MNRITVLEAREKICPFMQPNHEPLHYGEPSEPYAIKCIASACMAWDYTNRHIFAFQEIKPDDAYLKSGDYHGGYEGTVWRKELPEEEKLGRCLNLTTNND